MQIKATTKQSKCVMSATKVARKRFINEKQLLHCSSAAAKKAVKKRTARRSDRKVTHKSQRTDYCYYPIHWLSQWFALKFWYSERKKRNWSQVLKIESTGTFFLFTWSCFVYLLVLNVGYSELNKSSSWEARQGDLICIAHVQQGNFGV